MDGGVRRDTDCSAAHGDGTREDYWMVLIRRPKMKIEGNQITQLDVTTMNSEDIIYPPFSEVWYHATKPECWSLIQQEGFLWGVRNAPSRCTYLARRMEDAAEFGTVMLEVRFDPAVDTPNNYAVGAWQCRVYAPIPLKCVRVVQHPNDKAQLQTK